MDRGHQVGCLSRVEEHKGVCRHQLSPFHTLFSRDFLFTHAAIDLSQHPMALFIPDAPEPGTHPPFFYVAGCHAPYDNPIGIKGSEPAADNKAVSPAVTGGKKHVIIYASEAAGYPVPEIGSTIKIKTAEGDKEEQDVPVTLLRVPGNIVMLLFRVLYPRGSGPEPGFTSDPPVEPRGQGRWSDIAALNAFQHGIKLLPLKQLVADASDSNLGNLPADFTPPDLPALLMAPSENATEALDYWHAASLMMAFNGPFPQSAFLAPVEAALATTHVYPLPIYPNGAIPHLADRLTPPQKQLLTKAYDDAQFLLDFILTKTSGIAARPELGYWISSRTLAVQPPAYDLNWGDLIKRTARASKGAGALFPADVTYFSSYLSRTGSLFTIPSTQSHQTRFRIPLDRVPHITNGFWSANLYRASDLTQIPNPNSIWARTGDFSQCTDTISPLPSVELIVSSEPWMATSSPPHDVQAIPRNWIPLVPDTPANVVIRCYGPEREVIDGSWAPKGIIKEVWDGQGWREEEVVKKGWFGLW